MKRIIYFFFLSILFFNCENDLDINADWEEIPVIYSILNSGSVSEDNTEHFIRVQKSFLGDHPAYDMAQDSDSLYYNGLVGYDTIHVNDVVITDDMIMYGEDSVIVPIFSPTANIWVEKLFENVILDSIPVESVSEAKDYGFFSNDSRHHFYRFNTSLTDENGDPDYEFKVNFFNSSSYKYAHATTNIVEPIRIRRWPTSNSQTGGVMKLGEDDNPILNLEIHPSVNGKMYRFFLRFNYVEVDQFTGLKDTLFVDWNFSPKIATEYQLNGNSNLSIDFNINSIEFFQYLSSSIPEKENVYRYTLGPYFQNSTASTPDNGIVHPCIDFYFEILDADLYNYFISQNSTGLIQNRPIYTNVQNGVGLVSSMSSFSFHGLKMDNKSNDVLANGPFTSHLNFVCFDNNFGMDTIFNCQ